MRQLTLGELIEKLEQVARRSVDIIDKYGHEPYVMFDFCGMRPGAIGSYRGFFSRLAIGYSEDVPMVAVSDFLQQLKSAVGKTYEGYKGGQYRMGLDTPLWVANYGRCTETILCGVTDLEYAVVLRTRRVGVEEDPT